MVQSPYRLDEQLLSQLQLCLRTKKDTLKEMLRKICPILYFCCFALAPALGERIPKTTSESLTGQEVILPDSLKGHLSVVIVGFSKSSQNGVKAWQTRARKQLGEGFDIYQVAVLEDAPRFVRGMITHAMKSSTPAAEQDHFLVVVKGETELKKAAGFTDADDPYVFLLDASGEIRWRTHGAVSDDALKELQSQAGHLK
jgi:hypothetical protein